MKPRSFAPRVLALRLALLLRRPARAWPTRSPRANQAHGRPRATPLRVTWLYISPDPTSQKVDRVQIGREMVVAEKSGPWLRVYANTDIEENTARKTRPSLGSDEITAAHLRLDGGQGRGHRDHAERRPGADGRSGQSGVAGLATRAARSTPRRARGCSIAGWWRCFPTRRWCRKPHGAPPTFCGRLQKADASTRPSANENAIPIMRDQMDEDELKKVAQALSPHPPGRSGGLRADRQQALRRLARLAQVPGEGSPKSTRSMPTSIPTARARRRPSIRLSTGRLC